MASYDIASIFPQYYKSLESGLRGELPEDVLGLLSQQAAERGVASGMPGSQAAGYAGLRNLRDVMLQRITGAEQQLGDIEAQRQRAIQESNMANWQRQNELADIASQRSWEQQQKAYNAYLQNPFQYQRPFGTPSITGNAPRAYGQQTDRWGNVVSKWQIP